MQKINVLIIDHYRMITDALTSILIEDGRFQIIGETPDKNKGMQIAELLRPQIVLLNADMSFLNGSDFIEHLQKIPGLKIIGMSSVRIPAYARQIIKRGARGYLTLNSTIAEFKNAL